MPARWARRLVLAALGAMAVLLTQLASGLSTGFTAPVSVQAASAARGHPNRFTPGPAMKSVNHLPPPPPAPSGPRPPDSGPRIPKTPAPATLV
ncbi:MAG TPA: hypothetical protein VGO86_02290, partial [Candidatus Dormibacteraeota bacterium]